MSRTNPLGNLNQSTRQRVKDVLVLCWAITVFLCCAPPSLARPKGADVTHGQADVSQPSEKHTRIDQHSKQAVVEYSQFDVKPHEQVTFQQPGPDARILNRVESGTRSRIRGSIKANGDVYLTNPAGILFGPDARVNVGKLYAAAGHISQDHFLNGVNRFEDLRGTVTNAGRLQGKGVHLLGKHVKNTGVIRAPNGVISLSAGTNVLLGTRTGHVFAKVENDSSTPGTEGRGITNKGQLDAGRGSVRMSAGDLYAMSIYNSGGEIIGDDIDVWGEDEVRLSSGSLDATPENGQGSGGSIQISGEHVALGTDLTVNASGDSGGRVRIDADTLYQEASLSAVGHDGAGGEVSVNADLRYTGTQTASMVASGSEGGKIELAGTKQVVVPGTLDASGESGPGGKIRVTGSGAIQMLQTTVDASGRTGGGRILLGGTRSDEKGTGGSGFRPDTVTVANQSRLLASATGATGPGGTVVVRGSERVQFFGSAAARPGHREGTGGFIELSSPEKLALSGGRSLATGVGSRSGTLLLDPKNIVIEEKPSGMALAQKIAHGSTLDSGTLSLDGGDHFGFGMALNGAGDLMAVGASGEGSGAVYLFGLNPDDPSMPPVLHKKITDNTALKNASLSFTDSFGKTVAFNGPGNLLAVGAPQDSDEGTAYLMGIDPDQPSNAPELHRTLRDGSQLSTDHVNNNGTLQLQNSEYFGDGIALNSNGDLLAVGARRFASSGIRTDGALYLFKLDESDYAADPDLRKRIAHGTVLSGQSNRSLNAVNDQDELTLHIDRKCRFGTAASLDRDGDILSVGQLGSPFGTCTDHAAYLFRIDPDDPGAKPALMNKIADQTPLDKDSPLSLDGYDFFGTGTALSNTGSSLVVGEYWGDTGGRTNTGAAYFFQLNTDDLSQPPVLQKTLGHQTTLQENSSLALPANGGFGWDVAINSSADLLAIGAYRDDTGGTDRGAAYLFKNSSRSAGGSSFSSRPGEDLTIDPSSVSSMLTGNDLTLQANNDVIVRDPIDSAGSGSSGDLTLRSGRSTRIEANLMLNGSLQVTANDAQALAAYRDPGKARIHMIPGTSVDTSASSGNVLLSYGSGPAGNYEAGPMSLHTLRTGGGDVRALTDGADLFVDNVDTSGPDAPAANMDGQDGGDITLNPGRGTFTAPGGYEVPESTLTIAGDLTADGGESAGTGTDGQAGTIRIGPADRGVNALGVSSVIGRMSGDTLQMSASGRPGTGELLLGSDEKWSVLSDSSDGNVVLSAGNRIEFGDINVQGELDVIGDGSTTLLFQNRSPGDLLGRNGAVIRDLGMDVLVRDGLQFRGIDAVRRQTNSPSARDPLLLSDTVQVGPAIREKGVVLQDSFSLPPLKRPSVVRDAAVNRVFPILRSFSPEERQPNAEARGDSIGQTARETRSIRRSIYYGEGQSYPYLNRRMLSNIAVAIDVQPVISTSVENAPATDAIRQLIVKQLDRYIGQDHTRHRMLLHLVRTAVKDVRVKPPGAPVQKSTFLQMLETARTRVREENKHLFDRWLSSVRDRDGTQLQSRPVSDRMAEWGLFTFQLHLDRGMNRYLFEAYVTLPGQLLERIRNAPEAGLPPGPLRSDMTELENTSYRVFIEGKLQTE